jgi:hypothetical protein
MNSDAMERGAQGYEGMSEDHLWRISITYEAMAEAQDILSARGILPAEQTAMLHHGTLWLVDASLRRLHGVKVTPVTT